MKDEQVWAAIKGAVASTSIIFIMLVLSVILVGSSSEDDGNVKGAVIFIGFLPVIFCILFLYYLALSLKENRSFKFAIILQTIFIFLITGSIFYSIFQNAGLFIAASNSFYIFTVLSFIGAFGAWAWSQPETHNKIKNEYASSAGTDAQKDTSRF